MSSLLCALTELAGLLAAYRPFLDPLPLWGRREWVLLLLPLCVAVSIVYKSIKCRSMSTVPREAASIFMWILIAMVLGGAALAGIVRAVEWWNS